MYEFEEISLIWRFKKKYFEKNFIFYFFHGAPRLNIVTFRPCKLLVQKY